MSVVWAIGIFILGFLLLTFDSLNDFNHRFEWSSCWAKMIVESKRHCQFGQFLHLQFYANKRKYVQFVLSEFVLCIKSMNSLLFMAINAILLTISKNLTNFHLAVFSDNSESETYLFIFESECLHFCCINIKWNTRSERNISSFQIKKRHFICSLV